MKRIALIFALLCAECLADTWYVDGAASGLNNGTSWDDAWTSFAGISTNTSPGDTILVAGYGSPYSKWTVAEGGTNASTRITVNGVNTGAGYPVLKGIACGSFDYIAIHNITFTQTVSDTFTVIEMGGCTGWLIEDCSFEDTYGAAITYTNTSVANSGNIIRHNTFSNISGVSSGASGNVVVNLYGDSNLYEYNSTLTSLDRLRLLGTGNVCRNNFFGYTDTSLYPSSSPYPFHTDALQLFNQTGKTIEKILMERNWDEFNTDTIGSITPPSYSGTNAHHFIWQDQGASPVANWLIHRFNVILQPGGVMAQLDSVADMYWYNDTAIRINNGAPNLFRSALVFDSGSSAAGLDARNNTFSDCPRCIDSSGVISSTNRNSSFTSGTNHSYNYPTSPPTPAAQATLPLGASPSNLSQTDPLFTNLGADDFTLQSGSPLRAAGSNSVTAVGADTDSTSLTVSDAKSLFDGWSVADADWIKIGSGSYVQIASIDYGTNVVTLTAARTWSNGDAVIVKGMEDVGALPYDYVGTFSITNTTSHTLGAGSVNLTATVADAESVRMVEFLVDGLPVGIDYYDGTTNASVSWTSDGEQHQITSRAYNYWAAETTTVSDTITANGGVSTRLGSSRFPKKSLPVTLP